MFGPPVTCGTIDSLLAGRVGKRSRGGPSRHGCRDRQISARERLGDVVGWHPLRRPRILLRPQRPGRCQRESHGNDPGLCPDRARGASCLQLHVWGIRIFRLPGVNLSEFPFERCWPGLNLQPVSPCAGNQRDVERGQTAIARIRVQSTRVGQSHVGQHQSARSQFDGGQPSPALASDLLARRWWPRP